MNLRDWFRAKNEGGVCPDCRYYQPFVPDPAGAIIIEPEAFDKCSHHAHAIRESNHWQGETTRPGYCSVYNDRLQCWRFIPRQ